MQWWPCMQDSKKDTDVYSGLLDSEGEYFIGQCGSRLGASCCPVSPPGTPAPSGHTAGKRLRGLPWWLSGKESACQCKRHERWRFDPWVKKILSRREWQPLQDLDWRIQCTEGPSELHTIHDVTKSRTWLNHCTMQTRSLMRQVAPHWISQREYTSTFYLANLLCFYYCFMESILF